MLKVIKDVLWKGKHVNPPSFNVYTLQGPYDACKGKKSIGFKYQLSMV